MIYGAIDIGSNAGRLLIGSVKENGNGPSVKKILLTRVPLRLGEDVFTEKKISGKRIKMLIKTLRAYKLLMDVYGVEAHRACATSAMREAENKKQVLQLVKQETGIKLEIIDGNEEAELIFGNFFTQKIDKSKSYLYIDVGGGSTEVSLLENGVKKHSRSFKIGTLRILKDKVKEERWIEMKEWVKTLNPNHKSLIAIGTGGNINRLLKMNRTQGDTITYDDIKRLQAYISSYTLEDRISKLNLRPDRADVIVPAADIYLAIMRYSGITNMIVPKVGLSDGIIYDLFVKKYRKKDYKIEV